MSIETPKPTLGMRHVALNVADLTACEHFYINLLGMTVEWRPDADNVYLTTGVDNLALHKVSTVPNGAQHLDHIGFIIESIAQVNTWYDYLLAHGVSMKTTPRTHRDGAHSFYCYDPDGNTVQLIYHPPLVNT
jgi:catechol 2,3-dioxygenase-like lactoylglutathione lyase family enzyme